MILSPFVACILEVALEEKKRFHDADSDTIICIHFQKRSEIVAVLRTYVRTFVVFRPEKEKKKRVHRTSTIIQHIWLENCSTCTAYNNIKQSAFFFKKLD